MVLGAGWKEYPEGVQVVLTFITICLEVYTLRIREVWQCVYTSENSILFGEKRMYSFFLECKEVNLLC